MAFGPRNFIQPGQILLIRDGRQVANYGDTRVTDADYGTGFKAACAAMQSGDELHVGPMVGELVDATITASNARVICTGTYLRRSGNYAHFLKSTGDNNEIIGLVCDGEGTSNTGTGLGIHITGDKNIVRDCWVKGTRGTTPDSGHGSGIKFDAVVGGDLKNSRIDNTGYNGIWLNSSDRITCTDNNLVDCNRAVGINSTTVDLDWIVFDGLTATTVTAGNNQHFNCNILNDAIVGELILKNVKLIDPDVVSTGVSYNDATTRQMIKLHNMTRLTMEDCIFYHRTNAGAGNVRSALFQDFTGHVAPEQITVKNCRFSDVIVMELKAAYALWENCWFGSEQVGDYNELFYRLKFGFADFRHCRFDIHDDADRFFTTDASQASTDRYEFRHNRFICNSASPKYLSQINGSGNLGTFAGNIHFDRTNTVENQGAGAMYRSNDRFEEQAWHTDANGDLEFDDTNIWSGSGADDGKLPIPGAGPTYFSGLGVPANGRKIWNINWSPDATQVIPEKGWIAHGGEWKEMT